MYWIFIMFTNFILCKISYNPHKYSDIILITKYFGEILN